MLIYTGELKKEEVYDALKDVLDLSNFSKDHKLYDASRMNELGYWKDEAKGHNIEEFAGVAAKSYALKINTSNDNEDGDNSNSDGGGGGDGASGMCEITKCKGIAKGACKSIPYQAWKDAVLKGETHSVTQYTIASKDHKIKTLGLHKVAVSAFDDKR